MRRGARQRRWVGSARMTPGRRSRTPASRSAPYPGRVPLCKGGVSGSHSWHVDPRSVRGDPVLQRHALRCRRSHGRCGRGYAGRHAPSGLSSRRACSGGACAGDQAGRRWPCGPVPGLCRRPPPPRGGGPGYAAGQVRRALRSGAVYGGRGAGRGAGAAEARLERGAVLRCGGDFRRRWLHPVRQSRLRSDDRIRAQRGTRPHAADREVRPSQCRFLSQHVGCAALRCRVPGRAHQSQEERRAVPRGEGHPAVLRPGAVASPTSSRSGAT